MWRETKSEIQDVITEYFTQLFKMSSINGGLSQRKWVNQVSDEALIAEVTVEEVKTAVFQCIRISHKARMALIRHSFKHFGMW